MCSCRQAVGDSQQAERQISHQWALEQTRRGIGRKMGRQTGTQANIRYMKTGNRHIAWHPDRQADMAACLMYIYISACTHAGSHVRGGATWIKKLKHLKLSDRLKLRNVFA